MEFRQAVEYTLKKHYKKIKDIKGHFFLVENHEQQTKVFNCWEGNGLFCISIGLKPHLSTIFRSTKPKWVIEQMDLYIKQFSEHINSLFDIPR